MAKQFLVIGAGRFGSSVARTLYDLGHDVMVVDSDDALVQEISDYVTHAVQADASSEPALRAMGIRDFDCVIVAIGQDVQTSIMACILLIEMGARYIVAKAQTELHGKVLRKLGVNRVVFPERDMGQKRLISAPKYHRFYRAVIRLQRGGCLDAGRWLVRPCRVNLRAKMASTSLPSGTRTAGPISPPVQMTA